jgi:outer membrane efflux protein
MHGSARRFSPAILVALLAVAGPGCSRKFFRERADCDVEGVITQKNRFPAWAVKNWHVYPDPRARFADPFNPDRPPYPPDDYAARALSPNPQHPHKKSGVGRVDGEGYLRLLEQWDAQNRAADPARGAPPDLTLYPLPPEMPATIRRPTTTAASPPTSPAAPVSPARGDFVAAGASSRAAPAITLVGEWVSAKPRFTPPTDAVPVGPRITELRSPVVELAREVELAAGAVPAGGTAQPPSVLPDLPIAAPTAPGEVQDPKPIDPKQPLPPPKPVEPKTDLKQGITPSPYSLFGSGDAANYLRALYSNQQGYRIKLDQAVELGLINSREFQDRREDLYLAALPVTLERFNFATQAFWAEQVARRSLGAQLQGAGEFWEVRSNAGITKRFPTGALVLFDIANQVVIDLGKNDPTVSVSNLSLTAIQPFLRGGGLAVNLEDLTTAERNMVYAMRSYARFRKLFYVATAAGQQGGGLGLTNNPYGLQGLSVNLGRGIGGNLTAPVVGFLPLLQQAASIANQQQNVTALERLLRLYEAFREGGQQSDLQVGQVEIDLLNARGQLLGTGGAAGGGGGGGGGIQAYLDRLDNFKLQLGLPLTVGLDLDNEQLKPIRLQLARFDDVYADLQELEAEARKFNPDDPVAEFRARWRRLLSQSGLVEGTTFAKTILGRWDAWAKMSEDQINTRTAQLRKERTALLDRRAERQRRGEPEPEPEIRRLSELNGELDLAVLERAVRAYEAQPWAKEKGPLRAVIQSGAFRDAFNAFYQVVLEGRNERLDIVRTQWPQLPSLPVNGTDVLTAPLDEAYTAGIQAALSERLDLMNARGQVVDAYRQIAVQANSLQGIFDVRYDLNSNTPAGQNRPFGFVGDRTSHQLVFNAELPLVRRAERNNYRAALIGYQRQKRTLMAFEDNIANDVRGDIRQLRTLAEQYKIQQRVVELAYSQVDNAQAVLLQPPAPAPAGGGGGGGTDAGSAAALTQQVLQAQSRLVQGQNTLYTIWVNYLTARMNLYLDLELMQLDDRGVWCDEQNPGNDNAARPVPAIRGERLPLPKPVGPADRK